MIISQHLRSERRNLEEAALAQLAHDRTEDARAARVEVILLALDDHARIVVAPNDRSIAAADRRARPHDHGLHDLALLDRRAGYCALYRADDHVAHVRVHVAPATGDVNHEQLACAAVVGHLQPRFLLNHRARCTISTSRQRLSRESGRHSTIRTRSPTLASLRSSCALKRADLRTILP